MLADAFPVDRLGRAMGTVILSNTVGFLMGPVMGGFLYDYGGTLAPFYLCSVFGLLALVGTVCIAEPIKIQNQPTDTAKQSAPAQEATAVDESAPLLSSATSSTSTVNSQQQQQPAGRHLFDLISNPRITACLLCCFVTSAALAGIEPALPIHLENKYHVSTSTVGGKQLMLIKIYSTTNKQL